MDDGSCDRRLNDAALTILGLINQFNPGGFVNASMAAVVTNVGAGAIEAAIASASWAVVSAGNSIVIGSFPEYLKLGEEMGAKTFNIAKNVWDTMTAAEQWAANKAFLDAAIANGSRIHLSTNPLDAEEGSFFYRELEYLYSQGYRLSDDGTMMFRPRP